VETKKLIQYIKLYFQIYKRDDLPEPKSVLTAAPKASHLVAEAAAREIFTALMEGNMW
jgi:hypothetical protein